MNIRGRAKKAMELSYIYEEEEQLHEEANVIIQSKVLKTYDDSPK